MARQGTLSALTCGIHGFRSSRRRSSLVTTRNFGSRCPFGQAGPVRRAILLSKRRLPGPPVGEQLGQGVHGSAFLLSARGNKARSGEYEWLSARALAARGCRCGLLFGIPSSQRRSRGAPVLVGHPGRVVRDGRAEAVFATAERVARICSRATPSVRRGTSRSALRPLQRSTPTVRATPLHGLGLGLADCFCLGAVAGARVCTAGDDLALIDADRLESAQVSLAGA